MMTKEAKVQIWSERIVAFERSGLSRRVWCATQGLSKTTLDYWRKRLRDMSDAATLLPGLVPIVVSPDGSQATLESSVQIELSCGARLRADTRVDAAWLALLVRGIVGC